MRVLHIFDHSVPLHSGYSFRSLAILNEQRKLGLETYHITSVKHYFGQQKQSNEDKQGEFVFQRTFPTWRSQLPILNQWDVIYTLKKAIVDCIKKENIDIIHVHSPSLNALAASSAAKQLSIPLVYEMRASWEDAAVSHGTCKEGGIRYRLGQWLEKKALFSADHVVTICNGLAKQIERWGIEKGNITIIPNAVDIDKFSKPITENDVLKEKLKLHGKIVIGFLGSFYRYEGLHILLEALPEILNNNPDIVLLLVGGGQEERALKDQAKKLGVSDKVIFTGRISHQHVPSYYNLIDIFVYPRESIRLTELVTPLKPLEAMAQYGLVAASDIGGHQEMIENGTNGVLFAPDSPSALAKTIINEHELRENINEHKK